jgi:hypothetical protein
MMLVTRRVDALRRQHAERDQRHQTVYDARSQKLENIQPGSTADAWPRPITANAIDIAIRQLAENLAPLLDLPGARVLPAGEGDGVQIALGSRLRQPARRCTRDPTSYDPTLHDPTLHDLNRRTLWPACSRRHTAAGRSRSSRTPTPARPR